MSVGFLVIPISNQTWENEASLFSDFSSFLPIIVDSYPYVPLWDFFEVEFTLRNLIARPRSTLLDRGLAEFIFPNASFSRSSLRKCFCCDLTSLGNIERFDIFYTQKDPSPFLVLHEFMIDILFTTDQEKYTFLSCGDTYIDPPDFLALFMPFTKLVWAFIFLTVFGWPLVLSLIENDFKLNKVLKDFDALFIGWAMILEQSHLRATNYKGRGPLYCYCGCVLLAVFILSNAYKGDNIKTLTKSFELVPLTRMSQILKAGYRTYSRMFCSGFYRDSKPTCVSEFFIEAEMKYDNQYTDEQYELWRPMDVDRKTSNRFSQLSAEFFAKCPQKAFLGWHNLLEPLHKELVEKHGISKVNLGEEFLLQRRIGWLLKRYGSIKVLKRMWTVVESGIHSQLLNISYKNSPAKAFKPRRVNIQGNISVQFVVHSCGVLLALLVFIAELHKIITNFACTVYTMFGVLTRNFMHQSQKAFLLGVMYISKKKNK